MTNPIEKLKDNIYLSVRSVMDMLGFPEKDLEISFSHQNVLSPEQESCVISIINIEQIGMADKTDKVLRVSDKDEIDYVAHYVINVQISFIGKKSSWHAVEFQNALNNNTICLSEFTANNLGYLNKTMLRNAPQKWETQWVDGWNLDVKFTYSAVTNYRFDWINKVILVGNGTTTEVEYFE